MTKSKFSCIVKGLKQKVKSFEIHKTSVSIIIICFEAMFRFIIIIIIIITKKDFVAK
jgi:hypothetical protein